MGLIESLSIRYLDLHEDGQENYVYYTEDVNALENQRDRLLEAVIKSVYRADLLFDSCNVPDDRRKTLNNSYQDEKKLVEEVTEMEWIDIKKIIAPQLNH